jgi:hypothetical protein
MGSDLVARWCQTWRCGMARQLEDKVTGELFEVRRGRGRPRKDGVLTGAQRQARYQAKRSRTSADAGWWPMLNDGSRGTNWRRWNG